jgi:hypothetical protein
MPKFMDFKINVCHKPHKPVFQVLTGLLNCSDTTYAIFQRVPRHRLRFVITFFSLGGYDFCTPLLRLFPEIDTGMK